MIEKQKILIVDDKKENLVALRQVLSDIDAEIIEATNGNEALIAAINHNFALAILDVMMPEMSGYELAELLRNDPKTANLPIVFLTAAYPEEQHIFLGYKAGGTDYIVKPYTPEILIAKINIFLELARQRAELVQRSHTLEKMVTERTAELDKRVKALQESEKRYRDLYENAPTAYFSVNASDGTILRCNHAATIMLGYEKDQLNQMNILNLYTDLPDGKTKAKEIFEHFKNGKTIRDIELQMKHKDGSQIPVSLSIEPVRDTYNNIVEIRSIVLDISDRKNAEKDKKQLEERLQQSQKLEAIGTLAGGIAHDFNNVLLPIIGYTELTMAELPEGSKARENLINVLNSANRAKKLVHQILTFSRQHNSEAKKPVFIQQIIKDVLILLKASLPSTIEIIQNIDYKCKAVMGDPTQIHQVIMNLCTNAYHSMEEQGDKLEVRLSKVYLDAHFTALHPNLKAGEYAKITVSDTGCGIKKEFKKRIFEPYFTTKKINKGTGLGLSVVHGIVTGHGGYITFDSTVNKGTMFYVYLPIDNSYDRSKDEPKPAAIEQDLKGKENILLVDDEESITHVFKQILEKMGYKVTAFNSSLNAKEAFRAKPEKFDLILSDTTMPNMTGDQLAKELLNIRPDIPIILFSGYNEKMSKGKARAIGIKEYVMKPISKNDLAKTIRKVLDQN